MNNQDKISKQIKKVFASYFNSGYSGQLDKNIILKILKLYEDKKIGSNRISECLKKEDKIVINQVIIGRVLTKAKANGLVRTIPKKELAISTEQKKYDNLKLRKIHNTIREITDFDRKQNFNIPSDAKYRIVFYTPQGNKTIIPEELQGLQYYRSKELAEIALNKKLNSNFSKKVEGDPEELKKLRYFRYYEKLLKDKKRLDKKRDRDRKKDKERWRNLSEKDWEIKKQRDREYQTKRKEDLN